MDVRQIGRFTASLSDLRQVDLLPYRHTPVQKYERLHKAYQLPETHPPIGGRMYEIAQEDLTIPS